MELGERCPVSAPWEGLKDIGPGRPPRNPLGIFKALLTKRLRQILSDRELYRRLWNDPTLRMICDIEEREKPYHPSQLTRFRNRVGPERLETIAGEPQTLMRGLAGTGGAMASDTRLTSPQTSTPTCPWHIPWLQLMITRRSMLPGA